MSGIIEGTTTDARTIVAKLEIIIGLSPTERLCGSHDSFLYFFVIITDLAVLAPARLILAFTTVVASVYFLVFCFKDSIKGARVVLSCQLGLSRSLYGLGFTEVIHVGILLVQLVFKFFDSLVIGIFRQACLFLILGKAEKNNCHVSIYYSIVNTKNTVTALIKKTQPRSILEAISIKQRYK